jgi:hypothetical protein
MYDRSFGVLDGKVFNIIASLAIAFADTSVAMGRLFATKFQSRIHMSSGTRSRLFTPNCPRQLPQADVRILLFLSHEFMAAIKYCLSQRIAGENIIHQRGLPAELRESNKSTPCTRGWPPM